MKKTTKKLVLSKETVRDLIARTHVVGGVTNTGCAGETSASCDWTCQCQSNEFACWEPQTRNANCSW